MGKNICYKNERTTLPIRAIAWNQIGSVPHLPLAVNESRNTSKSSSCVILEHNSSIWHLIRNRLSNDKRKAQATQATHLQHHTSRIPQTENPNEHI